MNLLYAILSRYYTEVFFVYGLSFFAMGLAVWLKTNRSSRLELARSLRYLGYFGLAHGLAEWGWVFIPIQETYVPTPAIAAFRIVHLLLIASSFTLLFRFGAELISQKHVRNRWLLNVPSAIYSLWLVSFIVYPFFSGRDIKTWFRISDIWARYLLAFPGALLTGAGLIGQVKKFRESGYGELTGYLRRAGATFVSYAILAGVFVPNGGFFPSTIVNARHFFRLTGIPVEILRALAAGATAYFMIRVLDLFDIENQRRLEAAETSRAIYEERDRIARELHDGVVQSIYGAGLSLESVLVVLKADAAKAEAEIRETLHKLNEMISDLRYYINELRPEQGSPATLSAALGNLVAEISRVTPATIKLDVPDDAGQILGPRAIGQVLQVVREALTNSVKHSGARSVEVSAKPTAGHLLISVKDDGIGFDRSTVNAPIGPGQQRGLKNMSTRAGILGGRLQIKSAPGCGTEVVLEVPLRSDGHGSVEGADS